MGLAGYDTQSGYLYVQTIIPGQRSENNRPYGSCNLRPQRPARLVPYYWKHSTGKSDQYDFAGLKMDCSVGLTTGWFGFRSIHSTVDGLTCTVTGYPGDAYLSDGVTPIPPGTMWRGPGHLRGEDADFVYYDNDTSGGDSGAPVYRYFNDAGEYLVLAVHTHYFGWNIGTRFTEDRMNIVASWRQA